MSKRIVKARAKEIQELDREYNKLTSELKDARKKANELKRKKIVLTTMLIDEVLRCKDGQRKNRTRNKVSFRRSG